MQHYTPKMFWIQPMAHEQQHLLMKKYTNKNGVRECVWDNLSLMMHEYLFKLRL